MKHSVAVRVCIAALIAAGIVGCTVHMEGRRSDVTAYVGPPVIVEQGGYVDGVVVGPPPVIQEWVFIDGGWFYYHPRFHRWVRSPYDRGWHPPSGARVERIRDWSERPRHSDEWREGERRGR